MKNYQEFLGMKQLTSGSNTRTTMTKEQREAINRQRFEAYMKMASALIERRAATITAI